MCRMFGFRSAVPSRAHRSLVEAENALAKQSQVHSDGWGIGWFVDDEAYIIKSANAAHACERFKRASVRLTSHTFIVHVRRATVGVVDHLNAHPFRFGRWIFAHNGTVFGFERLRAFVEEHTETCFRPLVLGDTDSEQLFYYLLTGLAEAGFDKTGREPADALLAGNVLRERLLALDAKAAELGLDRPIVNVLLTDGRLMVCHKAGMPLWMSTQKRFCADFPTCPEPTKVCMRPERPAGHPVNHLIVASERIGTDENYWEDIEDGSTIVVDGSFRLSITGPPPGWAVPPVPERYRVAAAS